MTFKDIRSALWTPRSSFNKAFKASETFNHLDGSKHYTWPAVRRQNINKLISDLVHITIFLTASGTLGPEQAKYTPGGNDQSKYGIVYHLGRFGWWAFALLIAIPVGVLWFPLLKVRLIWEPVPIPFPLTHRLFITYVSSHLSKKKFMYLL